MSDIQYINLLTHDKFPPEICGFCLQYGKDKLTGKTFVHHNGFDNISQEDVENFEQILNTLKVFVAIKEKYNDTTYI